MKKSLQAMLAGALLIGALAIPASGQMNAKPILESAEFRSSSAHETGYFSTTNRPLTVIVGSEPELSDNTYGYLSARYLKWNKKKSKWVPMKKSGEYPKGWSGGYWNSALQRFEVGFVNAATRGKCKIIAKYADYQYDDTITKDKRVFKCKQGFSSQ